jgi:hypothetical protein
MKKLIYLSLFLVTSMGYAQTVFDFEGAAPVFGDFNGSMTQVIGNPDATGVNTSAMVAENLVPANAAFAGVNIPAALDISTDRGFTMHVWSPVAATPVLLKLENATTGVNAERSAVTTTTSAWEEITFDFSAEGALTFESVTIFMNFNVVDPADQTYYWDNLVQFNVGGGGDPVALPITFDDPSIGYTILGFEGAISTIEANPDMSGSNTSSNVVRTEKSVGAQFYAGTLVSIDVPIDFSNDETIVIQSWSPKAGIPVRLKLETADPNVFVEQDVNTTSADQWEALTWDFTGQTGGNDFVKAVVFYEFVVDLPGDGSVYYFDNIRTGDQLGVNDFNANSIALYPNPANNELNISSEEVVTQIAVYTLLGQEVISASPNNTNPTIEVASLKAGMYLATISTEEGSKTVRFIKK